MDSTQNNYDEDILMLQLDGVLDFDAVKRAAQNGIVRVRNSSTENPLVQIGSSLYSGKWTQTLGTNMLFCVDDGTAKIGRMNPTLTKLTETNQEKPQLHLLSISETRLVANKVLLTTETNNSIQDQQ